ncbi:uncharacterized protein LOC115998063 isoform X1 [Ipomoea triloba]|uniref:uncharacterized protein LOC115998063 isoform X1 n=1 Tax=Ipomoea triloba TaxID=35885 RepID=UPI00125CF7A0|nr:uncharacterized protein LOC115998063 isoform X1 [Ipomoea triloba]
MASFISTSTTAPSAATLSFSAPNKPQCSITQINLSSLWGSRIAVPSIRISNAARRRSSSQQIFKTAISCSIVAEAETLETVRSTIAKQLSIDESAVTPQTKFAELGADSLDTVEIMMALEERFGVSIGEGGAENVATVQDAADLIQNVIADAA